MERTREGRMADSGSELRKRVTGSERLRLSEGYNCGQGFMVASETKSAKVVEISLSFSFRSVLG